MPTTSIHPTLFADTATFASGQVASSQSSPCSRSELGSDRCAWLRVAPGASLPSALFGGLHNVRATDGRVPLAGASAPVQVAHDHVEGGVM